MNIKNFLKGSALFGLSTLMLTGCASDYLDTPQHGIVESSQIANTTADARATLRGIAVGMIVPWDNIRFSPAQCFMQGETGVSYYLGELPGQDNYVNVSLQLTELANMKEGSLTTGTWVWTRSMWLYCYGLISQANELLTYIDGAEGPEAEREFVKGQAYTLRAHFYFRLLQVYGPRWENSENGEKLSSIVLRTTVNEPKDEDVATMNVILDQIYSDLDNAIEAFGKAGSTARTTTYEPTLNVAYGVYARTAALKHDWEKCREMAQKARQGYRLATMAEGMSGYNKFNDKEWMWAPSFESIDNWIYGNWCTFFACNAYAAINMRYTNSINIMLYRQIPETDMRRDWWLTIDKLPGVNKRMAYSKRGVNPVNQQFTAAALVTAARTWLDDHQKAYALPGNPAYSGEGSGAQCTSEVRDGAQVKFWCNGLTGENGTAQVPYMRAAEMYLLEAEACAELGRDSEAQALLNDVNRVYNPDYTCTATGAALIDEVRLYRRIELWGEGFNWFDLKRWNLPMVREAWVENEPESGNIPPDVAVTVPTTRCNGWRYCVPLEERAYNNAITEPIPGEILTD